MWYFAPPHFFAPVKMLRIFPYLAQKNVSYRRNVMRKFFELVGRKVYKKVYKKLIKNDQKCSFIFKKKI